MAGYAQMMQQMKKMQRDIEKKQAELDAREFTAEAGAGVVKVTALGTKEITEIIVADALSVEEDKEMLIDLIRLAVNTVMKEIEEVSDSELNKLTGGMNVPGLF